MQPQQFIDCKKNWISLFGNRYKTLMSCSIQVVKMIDIPRFTIRLFYDFDQTSKIVITIPLIVDSNTELVIKININI